MRWTKLIVATLVAAATLQPLVGQVSQPPASTDSNKTDKLDQARASGFDFARLADLTRTLAQPGANRPLDSRVIILDPKQARLLANESVCFTLHVFKFSQKDGEPPHMVGSTTCTPAQSVNPKEAEGTDESGGKTRSVPRLFHPL
jgi:hypothetical protein